MRDAEFVDVTGVRLLGGYVLELTWADGAVTTVMSSRTSSARRARRSRTTRQRSPRSPSMPRRARSSGRTVRTLHPWSFAGQVGWPHTVRSCLPSQ